MHTTSFLGALLAASMAAASPVLNTRAEQCGVHIIQYQKNENGIGGDYQFDASLKDKNGLEIGALNHEVIPAGQTHQITSSLAPFHITALNVDSDPVIFEFAGFNFASSSPNCQFGDYDSGSRQGDCGFSC